MISQFRFLLKQFALCALLITILLSVCEVRSQDAREALGPKDDKSSAAWKKEPHPLNKLEATLNSKLLPQLRGQHPRVYVTAAELDALRQRARTTHREIWQQTLQNIRALKVEAPPPPAETRRAQNEVGIGIAEAALAYKIEGDRKYLDAAKRYMDAAVSYDIWGYSYNKPNVDLAAGHLLYGMGWGYDLLYHDLSESERVRYREKLTKQARLLAAYYKPKPGRTYSYSQNHVFIPMAGLAVTAYALYDEVEDAPAWASLSRAIYDRVLTTFSQDGYYYEGFEYWIFSTPWLVHFLDAQAHATGEDLYDRPGFREMHKYVAHSMLPSGQYVFDFGDIFEGPLTRAGRGQDYKRTHPGGRFYTNYNLLYRLAQRFKSGEAQGVAQWLKGFNQINAEDFWSLLWYDPTVKPVSITAQPAWHYFPDHEVVYWRSGWTKEATAFAFKCGPPEGHHTADLLKRFPDWHLSSGHAHPDANSFIIYAGGQYLTGDTGYAGVPMTEHHNSVLIGGRGQAREGKGHDVWAGVSYDLLNRIKIEEVKVERNEVLIRGDATAAYEGDVGLTRFRRNFRYTAPDNFIVEDEIETAKPQIITTLLHADDVIMKQTESRFAIKSAGVQLRVNVEAPQDARSVVEPNVLITAGPPGSVDKGERQERGQRLAVSTRVPVTKASFTMKLEVERGSP